MMRVARLLLMLVVLAELAACASAEIRIRVDQYDEDPHVDLPMTPRKANGLIENLRTLQSEARADVALRVQLATDAFQIYEAAWKIIGQDDKPVKKLRRRLAKYSTAVAQTYAHHATVTEKAITSLRYYVTRYEDEVNRSKDGHAEDEANRSEEDHADDLPPCNKRETKNWWQRLITGPPRSAKRGDDCVREKIRTKLYRWESHALALTAEAIASFQTVGITGAGVEDRSGNAAGSSPPPYIGSTFNVDWTGLEFAINAAYYSARIDGNEDLMSLYRQLGENIARRIRSMAQAVAASGRPVPINALRSPYTPSTLQGSRLAVANELETLRNDLPPTATSRVALANLVTGTSRFFELIDRLQDPGDPIWRVVRDRDNEPHWQERVTETYFYAEGDAGVVIVRDDPVHYRVHSARNDPTVLVQTQLEVSRTLANAAISIAGAASGLPTDSLASSASGRTTDTGIGGEPDGLALRDAQVDAWQKQRTVALTSLHRYLRGISSNLDEIADGGDATDDDREALKQQVLRLRSILEGHRPLFVTPEAGSE